MSPASPATLPKRRPRHPSGPLMLDRPAPSEPLVPPTRSTGRPVSLIPARPDLKKFRDNLVKGMIARNMTASDVARAMWGEKKNALGNMVAKGRDRMTHYLAGSTYPNEANVTKLARILGLSPADLAIEPDKNWRSRAKARPPTPPAAVSPNYDREIDAALTFQMKVPGYIDVTFQKRIPQALAFRWLEFTRQLVFTDYEGTEAETEDEENGDTDTDKA